MVTADLPSKLRCTKMCKFWIYQRCTMGNACNFAHSTDVQERPDLVSTELCYQFMSKGHCRRGAACTFAHGRNHLRVLDADGKGTKLPMEEMKLAAAQPDAGMSDVTSLVLRLETSLQLSFRPPPGLPAPTSGQDEGEAEAKKSNRGTLVQLSASPRGFLGTHQPSKKCEGPSDTAPGQIFWL